MDIVDDDGTVFIVILEQLLCIVLVPVLVALGVRESFLKWIVAFFWERGNKVYFVVDIAIFLNLKRLNFFLRIWEK